MRPLRRLEEVLPNRIRRHYASKLAVVFLLIVAVLGGFGWYTHEQVSEQVRENVEDQLVAVAELQAAEIGKWTRERQFTTRTLSRAAVFQRSTPVVRRALQRELDRLPADVVTLHYLNTRTGEIVTSTDESMVGRDVRELGYEWAQPFALVFFDRAEVAMSDPYRRNETHYVAFVSPVVGGQDRALVLVTSVSERAESFRTPIDRGFTVVVDAHTRQILFAGEEQSILTTYASGTNASFVDPDVTETTVQQLRVDGQSVVVGAAPVEQQGWLVLVHAPTQRAYATVQNVREQLLVLSAVTVAGLLLVGITVTSDVNRALRVLRGYVEDIEAGELDAEITATRSDEFGQLVEQFDRIRHTMRENLDTIEAKAAEARRRQAEAERARQRAERRAQELRFVQQLVEQSGVGVAAYTADGSIEYANRAYAELVGRSPDGIEAASIWEINPAVTPSGFDEFWESFDPGETRQIETEHRHTNGTVFPVEMTVSRVDLDGDVYHVTTVRDITARRQREERLTVLNRILRHNLRNELNVILGGAETVHHRVDHTVAEDLVESIIRSGERLRRISDKSTTVAQTLEDSSDDTKPVDIGEVLQTAVDRIDEARDDVTVSTDIPTETWVEADDSLELALQEVVKNAVIHNDHDDPEVSIEVTDGSLPSSVEIRVTDNGPGIPEDESAVVSGDRQITQLQHGSGLGLWTVSWVVQQFDGEFTVEDRSPRGTVATIQLPKTTEREE